MKHGEIETLFQYWSGLRGTQEIPKRGQFDPRAVPETLESMLIIERVSKGDLRIRCAGLTLCEFAGMELRGMRPDILADPEHRADLNRLLEQVVEGPTVAVAEVTVSDARNHETNSRLLLLPMQNDLGDVNRILACLRAPEVSPTYPAYFRIDSISLDLPTCAEAAKPYPGFAEDSAAFLAPQAPSLRPIDGRGSGRAPGRRGHLRLVD